MAPITYAHLFALEVVTRMSSVASLLGSVFIVATFLCFKPFRTSKTRLIFYATWANIITNVATLISTSALPRDSDHVAPLCEVQAFLLQWFMLADSFWVRAPSDLEAMTDFSRCSAWPPTSGTYFSEDNVTRRSWQPWKKFTLCLHTGLLGLPRLSTSSMIMLPNIASWVQLL